MINRLIGVITLKAATYREIADDKTATPQAAAIVVVVALIVGILTGLLFTALGAGGGLIGAVIRGLVTALIGWAIGSWVFAFVSKTFFQGKTDTGEMMRVFGYTNIFQLLGIIPVLGTIVGLILSVIGAIIGIREASEFDTTKAILTGAVGFVILLIVAFVLGLIYALVGLGAAVATGGA
jgi:Yip1 domain